HVFTRRVDLWTASPMGLERAFSMPDTFQELLDRARTGDAEACASLFRRFGPHVRRVVRRHLSQRLRKVFDSLDLTQDVWASFFAHILPGQDFRTPADLLGFLTGVARHKAIGLHDRQVRTQKRS